MAAKNKPSLADKLEKRTLKHEGESEFESFARYATTSARSENHLIRCPFVISHQGEGDLRG